jgi:hypothetical protein
MGKQVLASSNSMVREYLEILRRISSGLSSVADENELRQNICLCILLAVTTVETFLNLFFQIQVNQSKFRQHKRYILDCLTKRKSIDYKIKNWPEKVFDKSVDFTKGIGKDFLELKELRNQLMHFSSSETFSIDGVDLHNVSDISFYDSLKMRDAEKAYSTVFGIIEEILKLSGLTGPQLSGRMLHWTAVPHA